MLFNEYKIFTSILVHFGGKNLFFVLFCVSVFAGIHEVSVLLWMLSFSVTSGMHGLFNYIVSGLVQYLVCYERFLNVVSPFVVV